MNDLSSIVSGALTGTTSKTIRMAGKFYMVKQPTVYVLARMLEPLSKINVAEDETWQSIISKQAKQSKYIAESIAIALLGDVAMHPLSRYKLYRMKCAFRHTTDSEQREALETILSLITGTDFFVTARLAMAIVGTMIKPKSPEETP